MSRKTRWLIFAGLCLAGCFATVAIAPTGVSESSVPPAGIESLRLVGYDESGHIAWTLSAQSGQLMQSTQTGSFSRAALEFFERGKATLSLVAGSVGLTSQRGILTQSPSLRALASDEQTSDYRLSAHEMIWWREEEILSGSDASLDFSAGAGRLTAPLMELDLSNERLRFSGGVRMEIDLEDDRIARVSAEAASIIDNEVVIERSVVLDIESDTYRCDRMTLDVPEADTRVSSVRLEGNVSASFSQGEITADTLRVTSTGWEADGSVHVEFEVELDETLSIQDQESDA